MALPIPLELPARDPREALLSKLQAAPLEHVEALLAGYEVLQALHDQGVLEKVRGAIGASEHLLHALVDAAKTPQAIRALRNVIILARMAGELEPELLENVARAVLQSRSANQMSGPLRLWQLAQKLGNQDSRRALTIITSALEAAGKSLDSKQNEAGRKETAQAD